MKKIALDLDGVIFDSENLYRVYTEIYDTDINKQDTIIDNTQRIFQKRYNWSEEECNKIYSEIHEDVLKNANIVTGVEIVLKKLMDKFEFIIVTARDDFEIEISREKLNQIGLGNIKIFNNEHHKIDRLINEKVDYIIDDDAEICANAADNNIYALYLKNNAANKINKEKVINVNNWGEIYKYLVFNYRKYSNL